MDYREDVLLIYHCLIIVSISDITYSSTHTERKNIRWAAWFYNGTKYIDQVEYMNRRLTHTVKMLILYFT